MNYSTLMEAYNVDTFEKKKKKKQVPIINSSDPSDRGDSSDPSDPSDSSDTSDPSQYSLDTISRNQSEYKKSTKSANNNLIIASENFQQPKMKMPNDNSFQNKPEIQPFYDEELEQYLNYKEFQQMKEGPLNQPIISKPVEPIITTTEVSTSIPAPIQQPVYQTHIQHQEYISEKKDMFYKNLINIGLFIFIGILIIFLCDQITEIAISLGMKRTVQLLEPYLRNYNTSI
jgi:hypothetical protein